MKALTRPRVVEIQAYRDNVSAESTSQYFHRTIYLPYVDGLSCCLRERFSDNPSFFALLSLLPPNKPTQIDEIERSYSLDNLESEVRLWRSSLSLEVKHECLQELFMSTQDYPSVRSAIQIIMAVNNCWSWAVFFMLETSEDMVAFNNDFWSTLRFVCASLP